MYGGPNAVKFNQHTRSIMNGSNHTLAEDTQSKFYNKKQDTATWCESENLWHEAFVQRRCAFLPEDGVDSRVRPVIFGDDAWNLLASLNT